MNTHFLISFLSADSRGTAACLCVRSLNDSALNTFALLVSHRLDIRSARLHKHPVHWKPTDYPAYLFMFNSIIPIWGGKGPEPLPAYIAHILRSSPLSDITSACIHTCGHFHFTCELGEVDTNTSRTLTPHREVNILYLDRRGVKALWDGGKTWHPPCTPPLDITRLNQGTHCPTPDTSDLCHLICDASKWQRGKRAGLLPGGPMVCQYEQWALMALTTAPE